eukprot:TRINITY_DN25244_c0_g1_i1.p1 TRINITY_DN25244_c0_g1~~TRINITY_DN25244_c0_g1_i1.p1  ORF type:complete len:512 (+),score=49.72 TRINITY_DN25244_c0_g1_i1:39-1538(+)
MAPGGAWVVLAVLCVVGLCSGEVRLTWVPVRSTSFCESLSPSQLDFNAYMMKDVRQYFEVQNNMKPNVSRDGHICSRLVGPSQRLSPNDWADIMQGKLLEGTSTGCQGDADCTGSVMIDMEKEPEYFNITLLWRAGEKSSAFQLFAPVGIVGAAMHLTYDGTECGNAMNLTTYRETSCTFFAEDEFSMSGAISFTPTGLQFAISGKTSLGVNAAIRQLGIRCTMQKSNIPDACLKTAFTYRLRNDLVALDSPADPEVVQEQLLTQSGVWLTYSVLDSNARVNHLRLISADICRSATTPEACSATTTPCKWDAGEQICVITAAPEFTPNGGVMLMSVNNSVTIDVPSWGAGYIRTSRIYYTVSEVPTTPDPITVGLPGGTTVCVPPCNLELSSLGTKHVSSLAYIVAMEGNVYSAVSSASFQVQNTSTPEIVTTPESDSPVAMIIICSVVGVCLLVGFASLLLWYRRAGDNSGKEAADGTELQDYDEGMYSSVNQDEMLE